MPEAATDQEKHHTVRKRNIMLILAAAAIIAGLCHAYCLYVDSCATPPAEPQPDTAADSAPAPEV